MHEAVIEIRFDDGTVRKLSLREAARIGMDIVQALYMSTGSSSSVKYVDGDFDVDRTFISEVLRNKYADKHILASRTGRIWHIIARSYGSTQIPKISAQYVLSLRHQVLEGGKAFIGPVAQEEYELLYLAIERRLDAAHKG